MMPTSRSRPLLLAAAAASAVSLLLVACDPGSPRACTILCSDLGQCPDGTSCGSDGYCYRSGEEPGSCSGGPTPDAPVTGEPDASVVPDSGSPDAGQPDGCGGADSFGGANEEVIAIPDVDPVGVTSAITAEPLCAPVVTVQIRIDITHTFRGDLRVRLTSPGGSTAEVLTPSGDGTNDVHEVFDVDIAAGEEAAGDWVLTVADEAATDVGTLDDWTLGINQPAP